MDEAPVLFVEDSRAFALGVIHALDLGEVIEHVDTLAAARTAMVRASRAVLIVDLHLPDGDGLDFVDELRANGGAAPKSSSARRTDHLR